MLFLGGGFILPSGGSEAVNAAQQEEVDLNEESLGQENEEKNEEQQSEKEGEEQKEGKDTDEENESEGEEGKTEGEENELEDEEEKEEGEENELEAEEEKVEGEENELEAVEGKDEGEENKLEDEEKQKTEEEETKEEGKIAENKETGEGNQPEGEEETKEKESGDPEAEETNGGMEQEGERKDGEEGKEENKENKEELIGDIGNQNGTEEIQKEEQEDFKQKFDKIPELLETVKVQQILLSPGTNKDVPKKEVVKTEKEETKESLIKQEILTESLQEGTNPVLNVNKTESVQKENLSADTKLTELTQKENLLSDADNTESIKKEIKPVLSIENLDSLTGKQGLRFHFEVEEENLMEHQLKVFYNSGETEELIWQENQLTQGELLFEKEGNYLVYLYIKDCLGNEKRIYENYTLGSFEIQLENLNQFEHQKIAKEEIEERIEEAFQGSNIATYQLYINGEQYKGEISKIPEGKCILTVEMEDTYGNSSEKNIEIIVTNSHIEEDTVKSEEDLDIGTPPIRNNSFIETEEKNKEKEVDHMAMEEETGERSRNENKNSGVPVTVAGILGSLLSGLWVVFRRMKH